MEMSLQLREGQRVVFAGLVCVDLFNIVAKFPTEDLGHRCLDCYWQRGGNASNSATVFSLLGGNAEFFGTLADDRELDFIQKDFEEYRIKFDRSVIIPNVTCPLSVVIISQESESRTVLHTNKNLPELNLEFFKQNIDLTSPSYGWIHFEGRDNAFEISRMLTYIIAHNKTKIGESKDFKPIITSLEAEKLRFAAGMIKYNLWKLPDVMFVSKDFAKSEGCNSMSEALSGFFPRLKEGAKLICAWGEQGAAAISRETGPVYSPAFPPDTVVDTCGAGDTFNAATIFALSQGQRLEQSIVFGCKIAGAKCGIKGFKDITSFEQK